MTAFIGAGATGARPVQIAVVGVGKIALDQHLPTIAANPDFHLVATVTRSNVVNGIPNFPSISQLATAMTGVGAVSLCTPPRGRLALVREAFAHGLDVMLEKPPAATVSEAEAIVALALQSKRVLHMTWHSREAAAVAPARSWLRDRIVRHVAVVWKEDVRVWHPGQEWIWEPGIGVFDPGINALSVVTHLLRRPLLVERAALRFPANRSAPIAADLVLRDEAGLVVDVAFDFGQTGQQSWDIAVETDGGRLELTHGATRMAIDGERVAVLDEPEYARLYRRFAELIANRTSDIDLAPFRLVADAFMLGESRVVAPFQWNGTSPVR